MTRTRPLLIAAAALALAGCGRGKDATGAVRGGDAAPLPPPADARPDIDADVAMARHMADHLTVVERMQEAVVRGQLQLVHDQGAWLAEHPEHAPLTDAEPALARLRAAAQLAATAPDLPAAATATAQVGGACAACHAERGAIVAFAWEPEPEDAPALARQMQRHQWAAARLWQGAVGPSDQLWDEGVAALATLRLDVGPLVSGAHGDEVKARVAKLRALATQASHVDSFDTRIRLYGELLDTCVGCHQLVRPDARPMPPP